MLIRAAFSCPEIFRDYVELATAKQRAAKFSSAPPPTPKTVAFVRRVLLNMA